MIMADQARSALSLQSNRHEQCSWFDFEGATWRLEAAEIVPPANAGPLPPNTLRVLMRISVTAKDAAVAERLRMCTVALRSEQGKRWTPGGGEYRSQSGLPGLCGGTFRSHPEAGQTFRFESTFIVPTSAVDDVEPIILLPRPKPDQPSPPQLRLRRS